MYQTGALLIFFDDKQRGMLMQTIFLEIRDRGDDLVIDIESPADVDLMIRNQCQIFFCRAVELMQRAWDFPDRVHRIADIKQLVVLNVRDRGVGGRLGNRRCRLGIQIQQIEAGALHVGDALAVGPEWNFIEPFVILVRFAFFFPLLFFFFGLAFKIVHAIRAVGDRQNQLVVVYFLEAADP